MRAVSLQVIRCTPSGKKKFTVRPWLDWLNEGRIQIDISLSSKSAQLP